MGRPSDYTIQTASWICQCMSNGMSLRQTCEQDGAPHISTVLRWVRDIPEFREQYARAREDLLEHWAEDVMSVSDNPEIDPNHKRIMVDSRKWMLSKLAPKKYGDKLALGGAEDLAPFNVTLTATDARG